MSTRPPEPAQCAGPDPQPRAPALRMPAGATDCHAHVFGPREKYGWAADRLYSPPPVFLKDYLAMLDALGSARGVIVQTGVHGTNNDVLATRVPDEAVRTRILVDNPAQLYGFVAAGQLVS